VEKNFNRDDYQIIILIQIGESLVEKIFDDHQVTIQNGQSSLIKEKFDRNNNQIIILVQTKKPLVKKNFDKDDHQITISI